MTSYFPDLSHASGTTRHPERHLRRASHALAIATALVMLGAPAFAQSTSTNAPTAVGGPRPVTLPAADVSKLVRADSKMLMDLVQANRAEVATGKLALEKSRDPEVKKFAQQMIDDHGKALSEAEALAAARNVELPDGMGAKHKAKETTLKPLSGNLFDKQYAKHAGVGDHESTVKLLKTIEKDAKDPDLNAMAAKILPTVEHHLAMAKELAAAKK